MGDLNINLLIYGDRNKANFVDTKFSYSHLPLINTPTRVSGHSKTLIDNIFYNKPMLNITSGSISSVRSEHLNKYLIEPSLSNGKLKHANYKDAIKTLIRQNLKMTFTKSVEKNTVVRTLLALEHFLQIINF